MIRTLNPPAARLRRRVLWGALICSLLGGALLTWGFAHDRREAALSYLVAFSAAFTLAVGSLYVLMIGHASGASWFVPLRRACEALVSSVSLLPVLFLPLIFLVSDLYPWMHPEDAPDLVREHIERKKGWLDESYFLVRSVMYLALLVGFSEVLRRWSLLQDRADEEGASSLRGRMARVSVLGLIVVSLLLTFASWDWFMSLEPAWFSNMYGIYVFSGGFLAALGLFGSVSFVMKKSGTLPTEVSADHFHAIGRLQLGMVIFWAYIGWAHVIQQWIANLPVEQLFYLARWSGGWQWVGLALVIAHFVVPFLVLLSRAVKRNGPAFFSVSAYLVLVHLLDLLYLLLPALHPKSLIVSWMNFAALLTVLGLSTCFILLRTFGVAPVPRRDPALASGLAYESDS